jgi:hypothetical protein
VNKLLSALMLIALSFTHVHAQEASEGDATAGLLILSTTTGLIALAGIGTYALTKGGDKNASLYLRENAANIQESLATGEGVFVDDMIVAFQVDAKDHGRFAAELTAHYAELSALAATETLTDERAAIFFGKIQSIRASLGA